VSYPVEDERNIPVSMQRSSRRLLGSFATIAALIAASLVLVPLTAHPESAKETRKASTSSASAERTQRDDPEEAPLADVWPSASEPWTGDLNGILERGEIRVLTPFSLGAYYIDRGRPRGAIHEAIRLFEKFAKKKLGAPAKNLKVVIMPVRRDQLLPFLVEGYGDIVMAQQLITPRARASVDFSIPFLENGREYVVTGPASSEVTALGDLAGE
jgi:ABC-type amino acid transport substrate-binding protein